MGGVTKREEKEEKKKEKFPLCESIGHRPLRCRCPKSRKKRFNKRKKKEKKMVKQRERQTLIAGHLKPK